jgi:hypothetical protein
VRGDENPHSPKPASFGLRTGSSSGILPGNSSGCAGSAGSRTGGGTFEIDNRHTDYHANSPNGRMIWIRQPAPAATHQPKMPKTHQRASLSDGEGRREGDGLAIVAG